MSAQENSSPTNKKKNKSISAISTPEGGEIKRDIKEAAKFGYKFYVYELKDVKGEVFYVGKGQGARVFAHLRDSMKSSERNYKKQKKIQDCNYNIVHTIVCFCKDELTAFTIESNFIKLRGINNLTNLVAHMPALERDILWAKTALKRIIPFDEWSTRLKRSEFHKTLYWLITNEIREIANGRPVIRNIMVQQ